MAKPNGSPVILAAAQGLGQDETKAEHFPQLMHGCQGISSPVEYKEPIDFPGTDQTAVGVCECVGGGAEGGGRTLLSTV